MYFRWKIGLPNQSQGRKVIPVTTAGGVEMIPGKIYKFGKDAADVVRTLSSVEELCGDDPEVIEIFAEESKVISDVPLKKAKKLVSEAEVSENLPDLDLLTKDAPAPVEPVSNQE